MTFESDAKPKNSKTRMTQPETQKRCRNCAISEFFPGITLESDGLCNQCIEFDALGRDLEITSTNRERIDKVIEEARQKRRGIYDVIVAYSGGKDSSYTLHLLKKDYDLNILALLIDNDFVAEQAFINGKIMTEKLGIDLLTIRPNPQFMRKMYNRSIDGELYNLSQLSRANSACLSCINLINSFVLAEAVNRKVPLVAGGYIGGQIPQKAGAINVENTMFREQRAQNIEKLVREIDPRFREYLHVPDSEEMPTLINPLLGLKYDENEIIALLGEYGWEKPADTGQSSSNCLLNDYAIAKHYEKFRFHSYEAEICLQVRRGTMSREKAIMKLEDIKPSSSFTDVLSKLKAE